MIVFDGCNKKSSYSSWTTKLSENNYCSQLSQQTKTTFTLSTLTVPERLSVYKGSLSFENLSS